MAKRVKKPEPVLPSAITGVLPMQQCDEMSSVDMGRESPGAAISPPVGDRAAPRRSAMRPAQPRGLFLWAIFFYDA